MIDMGKIEPGSTIRIPFGSYTATTGASSAMTNYAAADIQIYKDGGTTQRASASGITATSDFDTLTGINLVTIDLADNTTADFYASGSEYIVVVSDVTIDSQTVRFPIARFEIGFYGEIFATTIATLASQTSFTLTAGSADNSAYVGCVAYIHDAASAVQCAMGVISAYTGSTKTVTLAVDPGIFTIAAKDNISIFPRGNVYSFGGTAVTARDIGASVLLSSGTGAGQLDITSGVVKANTTQLSGQSVTAGSGVTFPASVASPTNITAATGITLAAVTHTGAIIPTVTTLTGHTAQTGDAFARLGAPAGASVSADVAAVKAETASIQSDTNDIQTRLPAALVSGRIDASVGAMAANVLTAAAIATDAITDAKVASDVTIASVTGAVGSVTGAVGSVTGNVGGSVVGSVGSVTSAVAITSNIKKNQALSAFEFMMTDSTTHAPATGKTVTVTRSIDGGAFGAGALSAVTEVSNGIYKVDFAAGDLNGNVIVLRATATACDDTFERIVTQP